ncbi:hypothetical protein G9A89_014600 [Geosiphon pyriformis]|nr:hypothetical protein G9A89_014600 [Geosiphon pyriformis]
MHTDLSLAYLRRDGTIQRTFEHYFWPHMQKDIRKYVESCDKTLQKRAYTFLSTLEGKRHIAATHIEHSQALQKERHDSKLPPVTNKFKVGNKVLLYRTKAEKQWSGKFEHK